MRFTSNHMTRLAAVAVTALVLVGCDSWTGYPPDQNPMTSEDANKNGPGAFGGSNGAPTNPAATAGTGTYGGSKAGGSSGNSSNAGPNSPTDAQR